MKEIPTELEVGKEAPNFTLQDQNREEFTLSDYKGKSRILLSFHPLAGTEVCAKQMKTLDKKMRKFQEQNALPIGISVDPVPSKKLWAKELGLDELRILSDFWPHGEVAKKYGLFIDEKGFSKRANVLIDEDQKIAFSKVYPIEKVPNVREIISKLKERR